MLLANNDEGNNMADRTRNLGKTLLIMLVVTVVLLIVGEIGAGMIGKYRYHWSFEGAAYDSNDQQWDAYRLFWGKSHFRSVDKLSLNNSLGYRNREIGVKQKYRIAILGGSFAHGSGATEISKNIASQTEQILSSEIGLDIEVINAAQGGFTSWQELVLLCYQVIYMDPDMVIVVDGNNELGVFEDNLTTDSPPDIRLNQSLYGSQMQGLLENHPLAIKAIDYPASQLIRLLIRKTNYYRLYLQAKKSINFRKDRRGGIRRIYDLEESPFEVNEKIIIAYVQNLRMMASIFKQENIEGVFFLQPHAVFIEPLTETQKTLWENRGVKFKRSFYPKFYNEASRLLSDPETLLGFDFIDSRNEFKSVSKDIWLDEVHMTDMGQRLFAEFLVQHIVPKIDDKKVKQAKLSHYFP